MNIRFQGGYRSLKPLYRERALSKNRFGNIFLGVLKSFWKLTPDILISTQFTIGAWVTKQVTEKTDFADWTPWSSFLGEEEG